MLRGTAREAAAEFFGTFLLVLFGTAVVAQVVLSKETAGDFFSINIAWGLAVTMAVYATGSISGAHLNPAVTLAVALYRGFPWGKVFPYVVAQVAGAFVASAVTFAVYHEALDVFDPARTVPGLGGNATAGIWATYPADFLSSVPGGLVDQIVGTALLVGVIFALTDPKNAPPGANLAPLLVGGVVALVGMTFGFNCGYAINPARDFGPRLFTAVAGWGWETFQVRDGGWWWVPVVGPLIGGVVGGLAYNLFIAWHHPDEDSAR
ncbi:MAG: MIP/aquaporin family protein [Planctomycetaceae bacterium]